MVPLIVFYLHIVMFTAIFTRRWQAEGMKEGILGVIFMALIFFVGWSMASYIVKLTFPAEGLGRVFDNDAAALTLLTIGEGIFYYFYFRGDSEETEETPTSA